MKKKLKVLHQPKQATLLGKTLGQIDLEQRLQMEIQELQTEIQRIDHLRRCEQCMFEVIIDIERYGGRCLPWYLDLTNWDGETGPNPQDYELGYYGNDNAPGTRKFIDDRLVWAETEIQGLLQQAEKDLDKLLAKQAW